jgi:hypothetical protein
MEYLMDYGTDAAKTAGEECISKALASMEGIARVRGEKMLQQVRSGKRDVYC